MDVQKITINTENDSKLLVSRLYTQLIWKYARTEDDIKRTLTGEGIDLCSDRMYGRVLDVSGRTVTYEGFEHYYQTETPSKWIAIPNGRGKIEVLDMGRSIYSFHISPQDEKKISFYQVSSKEPRKILVGKGLGTNISFSREDHDLEEILVRGLKDNPKIKDENDLRKLNDWVNRLGDYDSDNLENTRHIDFDQPIGYVWKNIGRVCRHSSGVAFAILTLHGLNPKLVATAQHIERQLGKSHVFLEVQLPPDWDSRRLYVVDPTWDFVVQKENLLKTLFDKREPTVFHQEYNPLRISFSY
ncbi:hypothetical protein ACFL0X_02330 [Nanoarchaeota archaeon]